jgi:hypothetical protein
MLIFINGANLKRKLFYFLAIIIWSLCIASLLTIRFYKKKRPSVEDFFLRGQAIFQSLTDEEKTNVARYDTGLLRLKDESFHLVGRGYELEEGNLIKENRLSLEKIVIPKIDPILLERQYMVGEAFRTLNNAEKKCIQDRFALIIYRDGDYYLCFDGSKYAEYVLKYGTECTTCEELAKKSEPRK